MENPNGFMKAPRWLENPPRHFTGAEARVLLAISSAYHQKKKLTVAQIAERSGLSRMGANRAVLSLISDKMLEKDGRHVVTPGLQCNPEVTDSVTEGLQQLSPGGYKTSSKTPTQSDIPFPLDLNLDLTPSTSAVTPVPASVSGNGNKPKRQVSGDDGEVLREFDRWHRKVLGVPYMSVVGRDRKCLRSPLKVYGKPLVLEFVEVFWTEIDRRQSGSDNATYLGKAKANIPGMIGQIPNMLNSSWRFDNAPAR